MKDRQENIISIFRGTGKLDELGCSSFYLHGLIRNRVEVMQYDYSRIDKKNCFL